ncbi:MAG: hypothetical protein WC477_05435 [Patescibacteria group bacterium]
MITAQAPADESPSSSEPPPATAQEAWEGLLQLHLSQNEIDVHSFVNDAISILLCGKDPALRAFARTFILIELPLLDHEGLYLRIAGSGLDDLEIVSWACAHYIDHPNRTASGLESLLVKLLPPPMKRKIAERLLERTDISDNALEIIELMSCSKDLLTVAHRTALLNMRARREYIRPLLRERQLLT